MRRLLIIDLGCGWDASNALKNFNETCKRAEDNTP